MSVVLESSFKDALIPVKKLTDSCIRNEHLSELVTINTLRIWLNNVIK